MTELTMYEHHDWARIEALLKDWPGATRINPDALTAYLSALVYPNGRDRPARTDDPVELERALMELMQEDTQGKRPPIGVIVARLGLRRARDHARVAGELDDLYVSEPAEDWVVAHAVANELSAAGLMVAVAEHHGRNIRPHHDAATCELCAVDRLEAENADALEQAYGQRWRQIDEALLARLAFLSELDARFPWRVQA